MDEILHQWISSFFHYLQGFIHPRWCRISSINGTERIRYDIYHLTSIFFWIWKSPEENSAKRNTWYSLGMSGCADSGEVFNPLDPRCPKKHQKTSSMLTFCRETSDLFESFLGQMNDFQIKLFFFQTPLKFPIFLAILLGSFFFSDLFFSRPQKSMMSTYPPGNPHPSPTLGKGKSSTQKCHWRGYVSSQEGILLGCPRKWVSC